MIKEAIFYLESRKISIIISFIYRVVFLIKILNTQFKAPLWFAQTGFISVWCKSGFGPVCVKTPG